MTRVLLTQRAVRNVPKDFIAMEMDKPMRRQVVVRMDFTVNWERKHRCQMIRLAECVRKALCVSEERLFHLQPIRSLDMRVIAVSIAPKALDNNLRVLQEHSIQSSKASVSNVRKECIASRLRTHQKYVLMEVIAPQERIFRFRVRAERMEMTRDFLNHLNARDAPLETIV